MFHRDMVMVKTPFINIVFILDRESKEADKTSGGYLRMFYLT